LNQLLTLSAFIVAKNPIGAAVAVNKLSEERRKTRPIKYGSNMDNQYWNKVLIAGKDH
jgi:hypothetical protein